MISIAADPNKIERSPDTEVRSLTLEDLYAIWRQGCDSTLRWDCLFVTPPWLKAWYRHFGRGRTLALLGVYQNRNLIGIAPLIRDGATARFAGDAHLCDYLDFIVRPGRELPFFTALIEHLCRSGVEAMDLRCVRDDAAVFTGLAAVLARTGIALDSVMENQSLELELPRSWESYLNGLNGKQRHEVRRKLRRLHEFASVRLRTVADAGEVRPAMDEFALLFTANRDDKTRFWDPRTEAFFRTLAAVTAREGIVKLFFLDLDRRTAAAVMCFDYHGTRYLYNNGYDRSFRHLSVGLLGKLFSIRRAVEQGLERYDFLKGAEPYKERLGGGIRGVYRCRCAL